MLHEKPTAHDDDDDLPPVSNPTHPIDLPSRFSIGENPLLLLLLLLLTIINQFVPSSFHMRMSTWSRGRHLNLILLSFLFCFFLLVQGVERTDSMALRTYITLHTLNGATVIREGSELEDQRGRKPNTQRGGAAVLFDGMGCIHAGWMDACWFIKSREGVR